MSDLLMMLLSLIFGVLVGFLYVYVKAKKLKKTLEEEALKKSKEEKELAENVARILKEEK